MRLFFVALFSVVVAAAVTSCGPPPSPEQGGGGARAIPVEPIVDVSCVLLRLMGNARVDEICATAEELAPYVPEIIATRDAAKGGATAPDGPVIAFSMRDPCEVPRKPPRARRPRDAGVSLIVHPIEAADASADASRDSPGE